MLTYAQISLDRLTIGDATSRLDEHNGVLGVALAQWAARDDTKAEPEVRRAANTAMDAIDAMLRELHALRSRLVGEIRESDDIGTARVDAMLSASRAAAALRTGWGRRFFKHRLSHVPVVYRPREGRLARPGTGTRTAERPSKKQGWTTRAVDWPEQPVPRKGEWAALKVSSVSAVMRLIEARLALYARRIPGLKPRLVELFAADLRDLHDALERTDLGGHYWVWSGLLLGWARDGAILPHDSLDADFAVTDDDFHRLAAAVPEIAKAGFRCDRRFVNNEGHITEVAFMRHGARFEFFRMFPEGGRLRYFVFSSEAGEYLELEASVPEQATVPFSFLDRTWLKHEDHRLELRSMYDTWEVPDPSWCYWEAPNIYARRTWQFTDYDWRGGAAALADDLSLPTRSARA
jgi:hypothetical protein